MSIDEKIEVERDKLNKLIEEKAEYKLILEQSKVLDEYIMRKMRQ